MQSPRSVEGHSGWRNQSDAKADGGQRVGPDHSELGRPVQVCRAPPTPLFGLAPYSPPIFAGSSKASGEDGDAFVAKRHSVRVQAGGMCLGGEWGASSGGAEFRLNER